MKIGLLGGSFNPPHAGHLHISDLAIEHLNLDKIWWIPTAHNPLKDLKIYENYENRVEKCQILTKNHQKIDVHPFNEIYTIKLVTKLKGDFRDIDFTWVMGADNFERLHEWDNLIDLIKIIPFAVFSRENYLEKIAESEAFKMIKNAHLENNLQIFATKNLDISSTQIRNNV